MFDKIKRFYDLGMYSAEQVRQFYVKGKITEGQYFEIIGGEEE